MAKKKKAKIEQEIAALEIKKRNGLIRGIAAFVSCAAVIWLKLFFETRIEWLTNQWASLGLFLVAIVCAGIAGMGMRDWNRARIRLNDLRSKL